MRFALAVLCLASLAGCNPGSNGGPSSSSTAAPPVVAAPPPAPTPTPAPPPPPSPSPTPTKTPPPPPPPSPSPTPTPPPPPLTTDPAWYTTPTVTGATNVISIAPGQNLQNAFSALKPGDVLELQAGTYAGYLDLTSSGTASAWVVVRGAPGGPRPVIDLQDSGELHVGASYLLLQHVEVVNGKGNNLHVIPSSTTVPLTNVIIRDVVSRQMASGTGAALKIAGNWNNGSGVPTDYVYIEDCNLSGSRDNALVDGVAVRHTVLRGSWLHDAVKISASSPGVFFKGGSNEILIENNLISGIRGNGAIMVGGDTGGQWFDALYTNPKIEGVDQVIRNNLLADFDDAAFEIRGVKNAKIHHNTVVAQTSLSIFRLSWGGGGSGSQIGNYEVDIANNLVLATGTPTAAQNDGNSDATVTFGAQLWGGALKPASGPALPSLPGASDVLVPSGNFGTVLANPTYANLTGLADAFARYALVPGSPAKNAGLADPVVPKDIKLAPRSTTAPSFGAYE